MNQNAFPRLETREDWWDLLDAHWEDIQICIRKCVSMQQIPPDNAQAGVANPEEKTLAELLPDWKQERRDEPMRRLLHATWGLASDRPEIHNDPGWHILCDLCSEDHCLYDDEAEEAAPTT